MQILRAYKRNKLTQTVFLLKLCLTFLIFTGIYNNFEEFRNGFIDGWNTPCNCVLDSAIVNPSLSMPLSTKEIINVVPLKDSLWLSTTRQSNYYVTGISALQIQRLLATGINSDNYHISGLIVGLFSLVFIFIVLKCGFSLISSISKSNKVFTDKNILYLKKIAACLFLFSIFSSISNYLYLLHSSNNIKISGYIIETKFKLDFATISITIIIFLLSTLFSLASDMQQENDLTI